MAANRGPEPTCPPHNGDRFCTRCGVVLHAPPPTDGRPDARTVTRCRRCGDVVPCYRGKRLADTRRGSTTWEQYEWLCGPCFRGMVSAALAPK